MVNGLNLLFQFLNSFAFIVIAAAGLAVVFGIMGVINLAHGEFILVGGYVTTLIGVGGLPVVGQVPLPVAMVLGAVGAAVFGFVVERVVVSGAVPNWVWVRLRAGLVRVLPDRAARGLPEAPIVSPLYDRLVDSMVATWGVSLIMVQGVRIVFGNSIEQLGTPLGSIRYGGGAFSFGTYQILLSGVAVALLVATYLVFTRTEFGMRARATIQDEDTARALGVDTERTYTATFVIGSALAGLAGALYAPVLSMGPGYGSAFLIESFVAVVAGGSSVVLGTTAAGGLLGAVNAVVTNLTEAPFFGRIALLVTAMLILRFLPGGVSGYVEDLRERSREGS
jgi:branched-chain amino acid transport system permease protein